MAESVPMGLVQAEQVARETATRRSLNGVVYAAYGDNRLDTLELERMVQTVPEGIAKSLSSMAYYFVPLAMSEDRGSAGQRAERHLTMVASEYSAELSDQAICHRNVSLGQTDAVFISTRLMSDRFALSFEFFINVGHGYVDVAGVPESFAELAWKQALADVRGETSQDAWEGRSQAVEKFRGGVSGAEDDRTKSRFLEAAFADALAIYLLSLSVDFDYAELREREYPLLAPDALAERLKLVARLFPPNAGYEFSIRYRRRS